MGGSPGDINEEPVTYEKRNKGWRMSCDVSEASTAVKQVVASALVTQQGPGSIPGRDKFAG